MNEQRIVTAQQTEKESSLNKFCEFASPTRFLFVQVRNPIFFVEASICNRRQNVVDSFNNFCEHATGTQAQTCNTKERPV